MSQRECAGFNWPPLSIPAQEPVSISPEAVNRAGPQIAAAAAVSCGLPLRAISDIAPSSVRTFFSPSAARGVGHGAASITKSFRFDPWRVPPIARLACPPPVLSLVCGVGHPHRCTAISAVLICGSVGFRFPMIGGRGFASTTVLLGVGQPASGTASDNPIAPGRGDTLPCLIASVAVQVGHPDSLATSLSGLALCVSSFPGRLAPLWSRACGVGHPVEPVTDVRSTDARRRKRDRPDPVSHAFQVILYKVDPRVCVF